MASFVQVSRPTLAEHREAVAGWAHMQLRDPGFDAVMRGHLPADVVLAIAAFEFLCAVPSSSNFLDGLGEDVTVAEVLQDSSGRMDELQRLWELDMREVAKTAPQVPCSARRLLALVFLEIYAGSSLLSERLQTQTGLTDEPQPADVDGLLDVLFPTTQ
jgi:hypothetical protein